MNTYEKEIGDMDNEYDQKIKEMKYSLELLKDKYKMEEELERNKLMLIEKEMIIENENKLKLQKYKNDMELKLAKLKLKNLLEENKEKENLAKLNLDKLKNQYKFEEKKNQIENEHKLKFHIKLKHKYASINSWNFVGNFSIFNNFLISSLFTS